MRVVVRNCERMITGQSGLVLVQIGHTRSNRFVIYFALFICKTLQNALQKVKQFVT